MNPPANQERVSPPWLLIIGLLLGGGLLVFMLWDAIGPEFMKGTGGGSANVVKLTDDNWQKEVADSTIPVLVDFWGPNCPPCDRLAPTIDKLADKYQGKVKVGKLNVAQNRKIAQKYRIEAVPTVLIFKGGEEPRKGFEGLQSEAKLTSAIDSVLAAN